MASVRWIWIVLVSIQAYGDPNKDCNGSIAQLVVHNRTVRAVLTHKGSDPAAASRVVHLINNPRSMKELASGLPLEEFESDPLGTRSLEVLVPSVGDGVIKFSGIGVIRQEDSLLHVHPPQLDQSTSQQPHLRKMATAYVANDGTVWTIKTDAPFGTYEGADLQQKVRNTEKWGKEDLQIIAAGTFQEPWRLFRGRKDTNTGWLVYEVPQGLKSPLDLYRSDPKAYLNTLGALGARLRQNHDKGVAHLQIHPGNWFVNNNNEQPRIHISDWSTAVDTNKLPSPSELTAKGATRMDGFDTHFGQFYAQLTPAQRALALDFRTISTRSLAPEKEEKVFGVDVIWSDEEVSYRLKGLVNLMDGYHGWKLNNLEKDKMVSNLLAAFKPLTLDMLKYKGGWEAGIETYEHLEWARFGKISQRLTIEELGDRIFRESLLNGGETLRADLGGQVNFARETMEQAHPTLTNQ